MAHEIGLPYANMSLVTDYDCWKEDEKIVSSAKVYFNC